MRRDFFVVFLSAVFCFSFFSCFSFAGDLHVGSGQTYGTIQGAIDGAAAGDRVIVHEGTYNENINFGGKNITVMSTDPCDPCVVADTIIHGTGTVSTVLFAGTEDDSCALSGLTITGGYAHGGGGIRGNGCLAIISRCVIANNEANWAGGIHSCNGEILGCVIYGNDVVYAGGGLGGCMGRIENCLIYNNSADDVGGGINNCDGEIVNCTIVDNSATNGAGGIKDSGGIITNCIIWNNGDYAIVDSLEPSYSCYPGGLGSGNIDVDPSFVDSANGNYRLVWSSACLDVGTNSPFGGLSAEDLDGNARLADGNNDGSAIVDMGCYETGLSEDPIIDLSATSFLFSAVEGGGNPGGQLLTIRNAGAGQLTWNCIENCSWLDVVPAGGICGGDPCGMILSVVSGGLTDGRYSCELTINGFGAINTPQAVEVVLAVHPAGLLTVPGHFDTIQDAIDASVNGDTVVVSEGIYYENISFNGKNITLTSSDPCDPCVVAGTIIDGGGSGSVVTFVNGETRDAVLRGFTIRNGCGTDMGEYWGGGVCCRYSSPTIVDNVITGNYGPMGDDDLYGYGGGIGCYLSDALISRNIITGNQAYNGGGVLIYREAAVVSDNFIYDNIARYDGGGVTLYYGGQLLNNTIVGNDAYYAGNLIVQTYSGNSCVVSNNIIASASSGCGLYWDEMVADDVFSYNNVWNNWGGDYYYSMPDQTGINGNISVDPLFVDAGNYDYHLQMDSPCITAGDPDFVPWPGETDIDREGRVFAMRMDIGADEYVGYLPAIADAGPDQYLDEIELVTLDGSGSYFDDPCGLKEYQWTQTDGVAVVLDDDSAMQPTFMPGVEDEYVFELVVSDDGVTWSGADEVLVVVGNRPPVADAGLNKVYPIGQPVHLDGGRSYDLDADDVLEYSWTQVAGPAVTLMGSDTAAPWFDCVAKGNYEFALTIYDGDVYSEPSAVLITAIELFVNQETLAVGGFGTYAHYGDVSGDKVVYGVGSACDVTWDGRYVDWAVSDRIFSFGMNLIQPKVDGDLMVWFTYGNGWGNPWYHEPSNCNVFVRDFSTGSQRTLRGWTWTESYGHPVVSGNRVVWMEHLNVDPNPLGSSEANNWWGTPFNVCGADVSDWDNPRYFTVAENVGNHDPYPCNNYGGDFDDVIDIWGDIVVWEGNGDIYGADISDLDNIIVFTICDDAGKQYDPAIWGNTVVWTDQRDDEGDIYGADISDRENISQFVVVRSDGTQDQAAIYGDMVVYKDGGAYSGEISVCCLFGERGVLDVPLEEALGSGVGPAIDGSKIVWQTDDYGEARGAVIEVLYSVAEGRVCNITSGQEYDHIQHAIEQAVDDDELVAAAGTYYENIDFGGKNIVLRSADPCNWAMVAETIIQGDGTLPVVTFGGSEDPCCEFSGFTVTGGYGYSGGGICGNGCAATISDCILSGNEAKWGGGIQGCNGLIRNSILVDNVVSDAGGGLTGCQGRIENCLIAGNTSADLCGGINNCDGEIVNCTIVDNVGINGAGGLRYCDGSLTNCIIWNNGENPILDSVDPCYSCFAGAVGLGNIDADPCFVDASAGDYHLRWDSLCVD
ncbi:MAG: right-handed parallel beta-helix repeat-containing protein, partial [Sedimentisphaerales bacterium]|nr:right-handed parallel beta-helix repeat-containing protein [Sedimentisphaerales bacterium]